MSLSTFLRVCVCVMKSFILNSSVSNFWAGDGLGRVHVWSMYVGLPLYVCRWRKHSGCTMDKATLSVDHQWNPKGQKPKYWVSGTLEPYSLGTWTLRGRWGDRNFYLEVLTFEVRNPGALGL